MWDIMGMANGDSAGYLVFGVESDPQVGLQRTGLSPAQVASFDPTPLGILVRQYAEPEASFSIHTPTITGLQFVVVVVAPFDAAPHICRMSYDNVLQQEQAAVYVRTENAETVWVPTSEHMRRILDRGIVNQGNALLGQIRHLVESAPVVDVSGAARSEDDLRRREERNR